MRYAPFILLLVFLLPSDALAQRGSYPSNNGTPITKHNKIDFQPPLRAQSDGSSNNIDIAPNSIDAADMGTGSVDTDELATDAVELDKLNACAGANEVVEYQSGTAVCITTPSGGGAPTTVDYLVGTADGGLSAEIVVGTSPGGELGGTWAVPTVDATHSGSAHHTATPDQVGTVTDGQFCQGGAGSVLDCDVAGALADDDVSDDLITALSGVTTVTDGSYCQGGAGSSMDCDVASIPVADLDSTVSVEIAAGTAVMGTTSVSANLCATVVTVSATGVATTDVISAGFNGDPTAVTGYGVGATDGLVIYPYPTANNVNFKVCNGTGTAITPGALTLNWRVDR